jgi:drug/metabolite transporter (DMT)-like permease
MSWVLFALLASILAAASSIFEKKNLLHQHAMEFSAGMSIILLLITTPLWIFSDPSSLSLEAIGLIFLASVIGAIAFLLIAKAMRHVAISLTSPFLVFEPFFTAIIAVILLSERLSLLQIGGIIILVVGAYVLNSHEYDNLLTPFKHIFKSKYNKYIFLALILYSLDSILDKKILGTGATAQSILGAPLGVPVLTFLPLIHFFTAINFILLMILFHDGFQGIGKSLKHNFGWVLAVAALTLGYRLAQVYAISLPGVMISLIIPIKRLSSLFSTVIGGEIFHEENILRKSLACVIMIIGAVLIVI